MEHIGGIICSRPEYLPVLQLTGVRRFAGVYWRVFLLGHMCSMGCFTVPKHKSKVAAASLQAEQQQSKKDNRRHGAKHELLLSSNKPVLLPDPDDLTREQSSGPGSVPALSRIRGGDKQQEPERGGIVTAVVPTTKTGTCITPSTRLTINHLPRALSAPSYASQPQEDLGALQDNFCNPGVPFSAPLSSYIPSLDVNGSLAPPISSLPANRGGLSLSCVSCGGVADVNRNAQHQGLDKRGTSASLVDKKSGLLAGKPTRLPTPTAPSSNARPLPLPHPPEFDDGTSAVAIAGLAASLGLSNYCPSPCRANDGYGTTNGTFRAAKSTAGGNVGEAMPLPPPALPTQSRTPVRAFLYGELAHSFVPECFICEGVFGRAYRAVVEDDAENGNCNEMEVAVVCPVVKPLQGSKEWMAEVTWLARLQDSHLCKLIGYCAEDIPGLGTKRCLVYDFLGNGSLDMYMKGKEVGLQLDWSIRMRVALDIAQGLAYLHNKAPFQVISRDLSARSIELDKDLRAKLSGFGLARCGPEGDQGPTMAGPYAAPESGLTGLVTVKSNAWSFGVMLLELLTGRRHLDPSVPSGQQNIVQLTKPFLRDEGKLFLIMDPELNGRYSGRGSLKVANLAFQCLIKEASLRPNLSEAVEVLKAVQTDEDSLAFELKKSRSLSQSVGSPVSYGRSSGDGFCQRSFGSSSVNSSPACDPKQRDREFLKSSHLGSATSSPSHFESRLGNDPKHYRSILGDHDSHILPTPAQQPSESRQQLPDGNQQRESEDSNLQVPPAKRSDSKQRIYRKVAANGTVSFVHSISDKKANNPLQSLQGTEIRRLQQVSGSGLAPDSDVKHQSVNAQKVLHPQGVAQSNEAKEEGAQVLPTAPATGPAVPGKTTLPHSDVQQCSTSESSTSQASSSLPSSGEIKQHSAEVRSLGGPLPLGDEISHRPHAINVPEGVNIIDAVLSPTNSSQQDEVSSTNSLEIQQQHEQEMQKSSSSRSAGSSRSSCAPALSFEPPMHREEFCVW